MPGKACANLRMIEVVSHCAGHTKSHTYRFKDSAMLRLMLALTLSLSLFAVPAQAWHQQGHEAISRAAAQALPDFTPVFLREGAQTIAHCSIDPDLARTKPMVQLGAAMSPNHYFDLERVDVLQLPADRYKFIESLAVKKLAVRDVGLGLYAIVEARQQLAVALAEYRKWPQNKAIQAKCLVYAGQLAHYAADMAQPLHTSIHFDGKADEQGKSPHSGIHEKVDDLLRRLPSEMLKAPADYQPQALPQGLGAVLVYIQESHKLLEQVYELEPLLPDRKDDDALKLDPKVQAFAQDRFNAGVAFTASMIYSAWVDSETIELPAWLMREQE